MIRRREPIVILLTAEELEELRAQAAQAGAESPVRYAQTVFRRGLGVPDSEPPDLYDEAGR